MARTVERVTYKDAGVDVNKADKLVKHLGIGGYGAVIDIDKTLPQFTTWNNPYWHTGCRLVMGTDGVGTKILVAEQLKNFEKCNGNIDVLSNKISNVRIWSYVANKRGWVENQDYWVERTKNIEDKLSDQLHEELTKSFIDKRISVLSRSLKQDIILGTQIKENENVEIDGQFIGKLVGLKLNLSMQSNTLDTDIKSLKKAARQAIAPELMRRVSKIIKEENLEIDSDQKIYWLKNPIATLIPGKNYLQPKIKLIVDDAIDICLLYTSPSPRD